ncbi:MAG: hypothetical protein IJ716_03505 [Lachnospiraceae bacterium]|nr:hypothetical protein [Lachnospiraceae bacterium]
MNRKNLPLILMLIAGAVTCVINLIRQYSIISQLTVLLIVLVLFYALGSLIKWTLDYFDEQNENFFSGEGEVIEKESEQMGGDGSDG